MQTAFPLFSECFHRKRRYSFEFRHPSWYSPRIMRVLSEENISLCISDHHDAPAPWKRTADFVYVRGHGPGGRYKGHYSTDILAGWAKRIRSWKAQGCDVFVFFDNDQKSAAPIDALKLKQLLPYVRARSHACSLRSWFVGGCPNVAFLHPRVKKSLPAGSTETSRSKRLRYSRLDLPCGSGMAPQRRFRDHRRECCRLCPGRHADRIQDRDAG